LQTCRQPCSDQLFFILLQIDAKAGDEGEQDALNAMEKLSSSEDKIGSSLNAKQPQTQQSTKMDTKSDGSVGGLEVSKLLGMYDTKQAGQLTSASELKSKPAPQSGHASSLVLKAAFSKHFAYCLKTLLASGLEVADNFDWSKGSQTLSVLFDLLRRGAACIPEHLATILPVLVSVCCLQASQWITRDFCVCRLRVRSLNAIL
jgi:hypothetical protein